jgi:phage tail sheath gpL-like
MAETVALSVSFNDLPTTVRVPGQYMEIDNSNASSSSAVWYKLLILGQMLPTGTAEPLVPVQITSGKSQADTLFGQGSMLSNMVAAATTANNYTETWALPVEDNSAGAVASGAVTYAGTATVAGTATLYVGGVTVQAAVALGQTAAETAALMVEAIADAPDLPVTAAVDATNSAKVVITARHKGVDAGRIDLRTTYYTGDAMPAGLSATITAMAGGAANPSQTAVIAAISEDWYHIFAQPWTDSASLSAWATELARRFGPLVQMDGRAISCTSGSVGTLATFGAALDSPHLVCPGGAGSSYPNPDFVRTAVWSAIVAYYQAIDPARPLQTLKLTGILAPARADRFTWVNRNALLHDGIATEKIATDGMVMIERAVTTYRTNAYGRDDTSYLDTETMGVIAYLRYSWPERMAQKFSRMKLADDGTTYPAGQAIVTPSIIGKEQIAWFIEMMNLGYVEDLAQFKKDQVVVRNASDRSRVDSLIPTHLVSGLRVLAGKLRFLL